MPITKLEQIVETVKSRPRKRLIAAWANDSHTIAAVGQAVTLGLVEGTLVGDEADHPLRLQGEGLDPAMFTIVQESVRREGGRPRRGHGERRRGADPDEGPGLERQVHARHPRQGEGADGARAPSSAT